MVSESKMREILFRGKRTDNGEWVTGTPFIYADRCKMIQAVAVHPDFVDEGNVYYSEGFPVDTKTVGQFTGLTDKNGNRIFEGDIIRYITPDTARATGVVRFGEYGTAGTIGIGFHVEWVTREGTGWLRNDIGFWAKYRDIEVISNIHDNPELLEGGDSHA